MSGQAERKTRVHSLERILAALLVMAFVIQCLLTAQGDSLANDEGKHLVTGWWLLKHGSCCLGVDNSPLTAYPALPLLALDVREHPRLSMDLNSGIAGHLFIYGSPDAERMILAARYFIIIAGVILLLASALLANRFFGRPAGLFTLLLLAFDPNLIAHFSLISPDALLAVTSVLFLVSLDSFMRSPTPGHAVVTGAALGLALISKFTALVLLPSSLLLILLYRKELGFHGKTFWLGRAAQMVLTTAAVIWVGYGFHVSPNFPFIAFPGLVAGFRQASEYAWQGMPSYLNGEVGPYWPTYFLEALALKTPIPLLLIWTLTLTAALPKFSETGQASRWAPLLLAAVFFAAALGAKLNIGVRHILPVYPLMAIGCGSLVAFTLKLIPSRQRIVGLTTVLLGVWLVAEALFIHPTYLAYFNQFAGGPSGGFRYLGDSNIDWGQDLKRLKQVMEKNGIKEVILSHFSNTFPSFHGIRYQYLPGLLYGSTQGDRVVDTRQEVLAVSMHNLLFPFHFSGDYTWLSARKPFDRAGYSIMLYDITGDAQAHRRLAAIYHANKLGDLARKECEKVIAIEASRTSDEKDKLEMKPDPCKVNSS